MNIIWCSVVWFLCTGGVHVYTIKTKTKTNTLPHPHPRPIKHASLISCIAFGWHCFVFACCQIICGYLDIQPPIYMFHCMAGIGSAIHAYLSPVTPSRTLDHFKQLRDVSINYPCVLLILYCIQYRPTLFHLGELCLWWGGIAVPSAFIIHLVIKIHILKHSTSDNQERSTDESVSYSYLSGYLYCCAGVATVAYMIHTYARTYKYRMLPHLCLVCLCCATCTGTVVPNDKHVHWLMFLSGALGNICIMPWFGDRFVLSMLFFILGSIGWSGARAIQKYIL